MLFGFMILAFILAHPIITTVIIVIASCIANIDILYNEFKQ